MKKLRALGSFAVSLMVVLILVGTLSTSTVKASSDFDFTDQQEEALSYLNSIREKAGLQPLELDPFLNEAAQNHADYLIQNSTREGHWETKGKKGFAGETVFDRARAVGSSISGLSEVISYETSDVKKSIDIFLDTAYHRTGILDAVINKMGVGVSGNVIVFNFGKYSNPNYSPVVYPYNGQTGVGIGFYGHEDPNPLEQFGITKSGYIISFVTPEWVNSFDAKIVDSKGQTVPYYLQDTGIQYLFPKQELKYNEKYTVTVTYNGKKKTWSFTTKSNSSNDSTDDGSYKPTPTGSYDQSGNREDDEVTYADFKDGQYWSNDMLWSIDNGLIKGYLNQKNAKTGKLENLLKPYLKLSEAQAVTVLYRYFDPETLNSIKPKTGWWASNAYQLAERDGLKTNGKWDYRVGGDKIVTRGKLAELLASLHFGYNVSVRDAVQFMYDAGISNGYPDANGNSPKTFESYGANDELARAHIVAFMKRYNDYLISLNK